MSTVINISDELAKRLQLAAVTQRVSAEKLANNILDQAIPSTDLDEDWGLRNQRRVELIRKSTHCELSRPEQAELDQLQSWLDQRFESFDYGLVRQVEEMKQAIACASAGESND